MTQEKKKEKEIQSLTAGSPKQIIFILFNMKCLGGKKREKQWQVPPPPTLHDDTAQLVLPLFLVLLIFLHFGFFLVKNHHLQLIFPYIKKQPKIQNNNIYRQIQKKQKKNMEKFIAQKTSAPAPKGVSTS